MKTRIAVSGAPDRAQVRGQRQLPLIQKAASARSQLRRRAARIKTAPFFKVRGFVAEGGGANKEL
jgi:hypothetical protein